MHGPTVRIIVSLAALLLLSPRITPVAAQTPPKSVLILSEGANIGYSGGAVPPTTSVLRAGIIDALRQSPEPLNIFEELIDRVRCHGSSPNGFWSRRA